MTGGQYRLPSWKRCNERLIGSCKDTASGCCGAVACNLCLIKNEGTEDEELGSATESAGEYTGDFGFFGYWRRAYGDDSCEFVVEIDGEEVGSFPQCETYGQGMDCRKLEGVVEYGYDTLRFKYSRPLQLKHHREGKCKSNFCGSCSCTNRFICFTMTGPEGCNFSAVIEYDEAYDLCEDETESPRWYVEAECGYYFYEGWISLERDQYTGDCLLRVPGLDEPIAITDCKPLTAEWEIENADDPYTPYQMSIVGTDCGDCEPPPPIVDPAPCCGKPMHATLYATVKNPSPTCPPFTTTVNELVYTEDYPHPNSVIGTPNFPQWRGVVNFGDCGTFTCAMYCELPSRCPQNSGDPQPWNNMGFATINNSGSIRCVELGTPGSDCSPTFLTINNFAAGQLGCADVNCEFTVEITE